MPLHTILELLATSDGYGRIRLAVDARGVLAHTSSLIYLKPSSAGETIPAFLRRLAATVQPGDEVELSYQRGVLELARITRPKAQAAP